MRRNIVICISIVIIIILSIYFFDNLKNTNKTQLEYKNNEYGFTFVLPTNWSGYSIVKSEWKGNLINTQNKQEISGPEIIIRHPLWTTENPRQDIPIIIFTPTQWDLIQQEKLSLGAAPMGPSELGRSVKYVFALPARYNYAFPIGFEEVVQIIDSKPLHI